MMQINSLGTTLIFLTSHITFYQIRFAYMAYKLVMIFNLHRKKSILYNIKMEITRQGRDMIVITII